MGTSKSKPRTPKGMGNVRVVEVLKGRIRRMSRGTTRSAEMALDLGPGYISRWWQRKNFDYETLLRILKYLEIDPCDFFAEVFNCDPDDGGLAARRLKEAPEDRVRPKLKPTDGAETAGVPAWIEELDELRYHDAEAAIRELWSRVGDVEGAAVAHYLGVLGSAYRSIGNLPEARECLHKAEARAVDDFGFGDVLQRLSYLALYEGDAEQALRLSEQAAGVFARSGLWVRFGEAQVDQAQIFGHLGDPANQWHSLDVAERLLAPASPSARLTRNLFSVSQFRAVNRQEAGDLDSALGYTRNAIEGAPSPSAKGSCWALAGALLRDLGHLSSAVQAFRNAKALLLGEPYGALSATIDAVQCLAMCRRSREAYTEAESTAALIGSFDSSSPVRAAAMALWTQARERRLAMATVEAVRAAVAEGGQAAQPQSTLGARLGRLRRLSGLSRRELSTRTGVPAETLRGLEAGSCPATKHKPALECWMLAARPETTTL